MSFFGRYNWYVTIELALVQRPDLLLGGLTNIGFVGADQCLIALTDLDEKLDELLDRVKKPTPRKKS